MDPVTAICTTPEPNGTLAWAAMDPVVVVGASLAGMAAAVRLAKAGHPVELYEATDRLGGRWAPYPLDDGVLVDDLPAVLGFPAPWRDLFRKSGRTLETELARTGAELVAAAPARYVFADGAELIWPTDRGEQYVTLLRAYDQATADRWRDFVDSLDAVWQTIRPLGLEAELTGRQQLGAAVRARLQHRRSVAALAADLRHPHLAALVRSTAFRQGSAPEQTPAWCAAVLSMERTFGRWTVRGGPEATGRLSVLTEALAARLTVRRVGVHLGSPVTALRVSGGQVVGVVARQDQDAVVPAAAVICTANPWQTADDLLPRTVGRRLRRGLHRSRPALAPAISHRLEPGDPGDVTETVRFSADGCPVVSHTRPTLAGALHTTHDFTQGRPDPGAGIAWQGFGSWLRRPPVTSGVDRLFLAGPFSPAGESPSSVVLSGALASYGVHELLAATPDDERSERK